MANHPDISFINERITKKQTGLPSLPDVSFINERKKERYPKEISQPLISEERGIDLKGRLFGEVKEPELIWTPVQKEMKEPIIRKPLPTEQTAGAMTYPQFEETLDYQITDILKKTYPDWMKTKRGESSIKWLTWLVIMQQASPVILGKLAQKIPAFGQWAQKAWTGGNVSRLKLAFLKSAVEGGVAGGMAKEPGYPLAPAMLRGAATWTIWNSLLGVAKPVAKILPATIQKILGGLLRKGPKATWREVASQIVPRGQVPALPYIPAIPKPTIVKPPEAVVPRPEVTPKEEALADIKSIMPRIRELSTHITASKSIGREIEPETYTELERLNDRVSKSMPVAYPKTAEEVRPTPEEPAPEPGVVSLPAKIPTRMTVGEAKERLKDLGYAEEEIRKIKKPSELFKILREQAPPTKVTPPEEIKLTKVKVKPPKPIKVESVINTAQKIIQKRPQIPVLGNVLIENGNLIATDLETAYIAKTDRPDGMYKFIGKNLEKSELSKEDFPDIISQLPKIDTGTISNREEFITNLERALRTVSADETRYVLTGVLLKAEGGKGTIVSTDGRRLSTSDIELENFKDGSYIIGAPKKVITTLKGISGDSLIVKTNKEQNQVSFQGDNGLVLTRLIEGQYPDYKEVMPKLNQQYVVNKDEIEQVLKQLEPYAVEGAEGRKAYAKVTIEQQKETLVLTGGTKKITIPVEVRDVSYTPTKGTIVMPMRNGEGERLVNINYLIAAIRNVKAEKVFIGLEKETTTNPIHIYGEDLSRGVKAIPPTPEKVEVKPEVPARVPLEEITPEQAQAELKQRQAGLKFPDESDKEAGRRIEALEFYAEPTGEEAEVPPIVPTKVEEVEPGVPRGWKIIQDTQWMKKYKTIEGILEIDVAQAVPKDGLRKFTFRIRKIGRTKVIRANNLDEAIAQYKERTGAVEVYEGEEIRRLERYEINRVLEDLEMSAFKVPPDDTDIKRSIETVMGTLSKEEMGQAIADVKLYTEKPTEENIQRMYDGGIEEDKRSYPEQYKRMQELLNRWNDLTGDEKEEFSRLGDSALRRVVDSVVASEKDMGFPMDEIEETRIESALQATFSSLAGILDLHAKFPKWARKSAIAVKRVWNTGEMMNKKGIWINRKLNKAGKLYKARKGDYIDAFIPASQRALLKDFPPKQKEMYEGFFKILDDWFKEELVTLKKKGILEKGFIERVKWEARENIEHYKTARSKAETTGERKRWSALINQEQEVLDFIKKMDVRYVHLPVRILLEQLMDKPAIRKYLKLNRFFRRRLTIDVADWVKELKNKWYPEAVKNTRAIRKEIKEEKARLMRGNVETDKELLVSRPVLDTNMLDIRRVVAAYAHKLGRLYGLADIVNAFQSDELIKDIPSSGIVPERYTTLPAKYFPEFKGKMAVRIAADWLQDYLDTIYKPRSNITRAADRIFGYFKLMQFTMPFFMPAYDVYQASIHWGLRWALTKPHKVPGVIKKAIKSFVKKDSYYWDFWHYGGPSKPFTAPWKTYMGDIEIITQDGAIKKLLKFISSHHLTTFVDAIYIPIWNANWGGDELIRLVSYHAMLEEGHLPEEAAQLAATVHSDYARMPAKTRRVLNKIFFVPVFPFTMAVWEYEMMKAAVLETMRLGAKFLGKVLPPMRKLEAKLTPTADEMFKRRKSMAKGLLGLLMMVALREGIQKALGFKRDVIGLRYTREIPDPDNPRERKELVKYIPTPDNVLLRHIFRWSGLPSEPDKVHYFAGRATGILHPLLSLPVELAMNRKRDFTPITELSRIWDGPSGWARIGLDYTAYAGERLIRILQSIPGLTTKYSGEEKKVVREWREITPEIARIMEPFIFLYIRNTKDERGRREAREWHRLMLQEARDDERLKGRQPTEEEIRIRIERHKKMEDALLNITGDRTRKAPPSAYKPDVGFLNEK